MAKIRVGNVQFSLYKRTGKADAYSIEVAKDFEDEVDVNCTLAQIESLGKLLQAFVDNERKGYK